MRIELLDKVIFILATDEGCITDRFIAANKDLQYITEGLFKKEVDKVIWKKIRGKLYSKGNLEKSIENLTGEQLTEIAKSLYHLSDIQDWNH